MEVRQRAMVAAQLAAWARLQPLLDPLVDTVHVQTLHDAFETLDRERIDLIICTVAFEESRMIELLQAVRRTASAASIPFVCCRALPSVLSDNMVEHMRAACIQAGADALVDIAKLDHDKAQSVLKSAVTACLPRK
jgi:CheY-like chemotaxis protein